MKILVNLSNHPSDKWSNLQKEGWDKIIDIPFPNVPPEFNTKEVIELTIPIASKLGEIAGQYPDAHKFLMIQGEYSFCFIFLKAIKDFTDWIIAIPTTARKVVERNGIKESVFEFVKWRFFEP